VHPENERLYRNFVKEICSIASHKNPSTNLNMNYILVLSGRGSYLKRPVDRPDVLDQEDDYHRMRVGIETAREVAALRSGKNILELTDEDLKLHGPIIIYNGRPKHNADFKEALKFNLIRDYPHSKFLVLELPHDQLNSKGHFISVANHIDLSNQEIGFVTSAYHLPRIGRMFSENPPHNYFGDDVKIYAYLYDRKFSAPGIEEDLVSEAIKIREYVAKGDLYTEISGNVIYNGQLE